MKHQVKQYNIVADDPIDERIYNVVLLREELNEEMLNDAVKKAAELYKDQAKLQPNLYFLFYKI